MKSPTGLRAPLASHSYEITQTIKSQLVFGMRVDFLPLVIAALVFAVSAVCMSLFILQGRYTAYLPTISETAAGSPNATVFAMAMTAASALLILLLTLYVSALDCWNELSRAKEVFLRVTSYLSGLFMVLVAAVNIGEELIAHMVIAILYFFTMMVLVIAITAIARKHCNKKTLIVRILCLVVVVIGFCFVSVSGSFYKSCKGTTINTVGEYLFFVAVAVLMLTFRDEMQRVKLHVVVTDERFCDN